MSQPDGRLGSSRLKDCDQVTRFDLNGRHAPSSPAAPRALDARSPSAFCSQAPASRCGTCDAARLARRRRRARAPGHGAHGVGGRVEPRARWTRPRPPPSRPVGKIDILVGNAGHRRSEPPAVGVPGRRVAAGHRGQPVRPLLLQPRRRPAHDRARIRPHRQHRVGRRQGRQSERVGLQRLEGRRHRPHQVARQGTGRP